MENAKDEKIELDLKVMNARLETTKQGFSFASWKASQVFDNSTKAITALAIANGAGLLASFTAIKDSALLGAAKTIAIIATPFGLGAIAAALSYFYFFRWFISMMSTHGSDDFSQARLSYKLAVTSLLLFIIGIASAVLAMLLRQFY